ncbi:hypothetical protein [Mucilaginibacter sp. dw_454]|uniref:hypothetical protein n=1 Tax=Mucilaginibacter sp. dw_454 TaxID=2720079 RepID=UPI001BD37137|nr:hypothetical protein [Mucilaginibacter sp. dw_454]
MQNITNGTIEQYNNTAVLGRYNNGYFALTVNDLPKHDLLTVSFDLYIHDTWDGNKPAPDGPDIWQMTIDENTFINTTFSNQTFTPGYFTNPQSYPFNYPNNYSNPKTGAYRTDLPGVCGAIGPNGTTEYKITKTFAHTNRTVILKCLDKLVQTNAPDQKCDESWSVDNITIKAITL